MRTRKRKCSKGIWFIGLLLLCFSGSNRGEDGIMTLSEVKPGMTGIGKTVFQGSDIEEFQAEILGIYENFNGPDHDLIVARLSGEKISFTGVIDGMSGSPVYIDGKLIGAVAIRFGIFGKIPIAGITPVEEMRALSGESGRLSVRMDTLKELTQAFIAAPDKEAFIQTINGRYTGEWSKQISGPPPYLRAPLSFSGFDGRAFEYFSPFFERVGFMAYQGGQSGSEASQPENSLHPGSMICVQLVSGDASLTAAGTVTSVGGEKILAFGHPFFKMGSIDWPLFRGRVLTVFPSDLASFKMTVPLEEIGALTYDGVAGVLGELGIQADLLPLSITLVTDGGRTDNPDHTMETITGDGSGQMLSEKNFGPYRLQLVRSKEILPLLLGLSFFSTISQAADASTEMTVEVGGNIGIRGHQDIRINNIFSGSSAVVESVVHLMQVMMLLGQNPFEAVSFDRIDLTVRITHRNRIASLEDIWLNTHEVSPGGVLTLYFALKPFRGNRILLSEKIQVPPHAPEGKMTLIAGNADTIYKTEKKLFKGESVYGNLKQLIKLLNEIRDNQSLHLLLLRPERTAILKGKFFPSLPPSKYSVMNSTAPGRNLRVYRVGVADDIRLETDYVISGYREISFNVRKDLGNP